MSTSKPEFQVPTWAAVAIVAVVLLTFVYAILLGQSLFLPFVWLAWLGGIALTLFVVYLLYRFVIAVETIADKM
jgi:hypothetical protein